MHPGVTSDRVGRRRTRKYRSNHTPAEVTHGDQRLRSCATQAALIARMASAQAPPDTDQTQISQFERWLAWPLRLVLMES